VETNVSEGHTSSIFYHDFGCGKFFRYVINLQQYYTTHSPKDLNVKFFILRPRRRWVNNIKMELKKDRMGWYGMD
jgi:hypothetical protein